MHHYDRKAHRRQQEQDAAYQQDRLRCWCRLRQGQHRLWSSPRWEARTWCTETAFRYVICVRRISSILQYLTVEANQTLVCAFVLFKFDHCNSLPPGCLLYILRRLWKVQNSAAKLVFKLRRRDHVQPLLSALHWLPVQARTEYKLSSVTTSSLTHRLPTCLTFPLCTHLPDNFVLLQTHGHFACPVLKRKMFGNVLSFTLIQRNEILSLLTSVTFRPSMPSKLR